MSQCSVNDLISSIAPKLSAVFHSLVALKRSFYTSFNVVEFLPTNSRFNIYQ
tara:strand:- start:171 stop:326 length:156 start_codon:yes stop_codon:yes gene_type:complete